MDACLGNKTKGIPLDSKVDSDHRYEPVPIDDSSLTIALFCIFFRQVVPVTRVPPTQISFAAQCPSLGESPCIMLLWFWLDWMLVRLVLEIMACCLQVPI